MRRELEKKERQRMAQLKRNRPKAKGGRGCRGREEPGRPTGWEMRKEETHKERRDSERGRDRGGQEEGPEGKWGREGGGRQRREEMGH